MFSTKHGNLYKKLQEKPCFGIFHKIPRPEVVDILALVGFDFVICDMEHAQVSEAEARTVIKACVSVGLSVVVRLPEPVQGQVNRLLEAGAVGIQMPRLRTIQDTKNLYDIMHYPPEGTRSFGNANPWAEYGAIPIPQYMSESNERALVVGQFETRKIDEPIDQMMEGLDVAFIGPMDLSIDFGAPANPDAPEVQDRIRQIEEAAKRTGTYMGAAVKTVEKAKQLIDRGYRYLGVTADVALLQKAAKDLIKSLHAAANI